MATDPPHDNTPTGANGSGPIQRSIGELVAHELSALVQEMAEHRQALVGQERKITGLINVLTKRGGLPFAEEHANAVGDVVEGVGDHEHRLGSKMYARADRIRAAGRKAG